MVVDEQGGKALLGEEQREGEAGIAAAGDEHGYAFGGLGHQLLVPAGRARPSAGRARPSAGRAPPVGRSSTAPPARTWPAAHGSGCGVAPAHASRVGSSMVG